MELLARELTATEAGQGAGRVELDEPARRCLIDDRFGHPVGGKDDGYALGHVVERVDEDRPLRFQCPDHMTVMDDFVADHAGHPEVEGTMGQIPEGAILLVEDVRQAESVAPADPRRLAYTTQTTLSVDDTNDIVAVLKRRFPDIAGPRKEDICYATTNRQSAVKAIAPRCDALLVIGAPNSSNSQRLVEVARAAGCDRSFLIQGPGDIDWPALDGAENVGITAGASAPEVLVEAVIAALDARFQTSVEPVSVAEENVIFGLPASLRVA